jgi:predicted ABC-type transport system involved in lysophospholipase L1 biosynthesis ATPase subunit
MRGVVKVLDGVDLIVHHGEILGLVGESGCGKTVTGLTVMGLLQRPQAGCRRFGPRSLPAERDEVLESRAHSIIDRLHSLSPGLDAWITYAAVAVVIAGRAVPLTLRPDTSRSHMASLIGRPVSCSIHRY